MKKTKSMNELIIRRYHSDVRKLKRLVAELNVQLVPFDQAEPSDVCILSNSDVELQERKLRCNSSNENYFISESSYYKYEKEFTTFIDELVQ